MIMNIFHNYPFINVIIITIITLKILDYNNLNLNSLKKLKWKNMEIKGNANAIMENIMMIDSFFKNWHVHFSNLLCDLTSILRLLFLTYNIF